MRSLGPALLVLTLSACGAQPAPSTVAPTTVLPEDQPKAVPELQRPPELVVRGGDKVLQLQPYAFCWQAGCVDGLPPDPLPDIGTPAEVVVEFPVEGWSFEAGFQRQAIRAHAPRRFSWSALR